jgi:osmotically inducible lipoprotein OsmB
MTQVRRLTLAAGTLALLVLGGCANMSECEKATAVGAGLGGAAGAVLTDKSALGTIGGAAAGGVIGARQRC